ncbi:MAG: pentapeptide repeat-containing protein [Pirellulales bacterium]
MGETRSADAGKHAHGADHCAAPRRPRPRAGRRDRRRVAVGRGGRAAFRPGDRRGHRIDPGSGPPAAAAPHAGGGTDRSRPLERGGGCRLPRLGGRPRGGPRGVVHPRGGRCPRPLHRRPAARCRPTGPAVARGRRGCRADDRRSGDRGAGVVRTVSRCPWPGGDRADFDRADFDRANFDRANFAGAAFDRTAAGDD